MLELKNTLNTDQKPTSGAQWPSILVAWCILGSIILSGCRAVGPRYKAPVPPTPDAWHQEIEKEFSQSEPPLQEWWKTLHDPLLEDLIGRARGSNLTVKQALSVIREARYRRRVVSRGLEPRIDYNLSYARSLPSQNIPPYNFLPPALRDTDPVNFYSTGFDMAWELDVFGGIRRQIEAADAGVDASVENYHDVLITLFAEVALAYTDVRTFQQRLTYAETNFKAQQAVLELTKSRYESGLAGRLDVEQATSNLANTESAIPLLRQGLDLTINRLTLLLSMTPGSLHDELRKTPPPTLPPATVAVGLPANLLRQRPDIRRAERNLAAQVARIGIVTADLYPRFGLSGNLGWETVDFSNPGKGIAYTVVPFLRLNLFNRGRAKANIHGQEEVAQQALLAYENTVLIALTEVEGAMTAYREERSRRDALARASEATAKASDLVQTLYEMGLTDFQNVLDTQRFLTAQQDQLAISNGQVRRNLIGLYKALGGGWSSNTPMPDGPETRSSISYK